MSDLIQAQKLLVKQPIKTALHEEIEKAQLLLAETNVYTVDSLLAFEAEIEKTKAIYNNSDTTQTEIDLAKEALLQA